MTGDPPLGDGDEPGGADAPADDPVPPPHDPDADRITLLWNGFEELNRRLDTTEDAVAGALDALSTAVDDLKTQLSQLLAKEREKDVQPRRWADRATQKDWEALVGWVDRLNTGYSLLGDFTFPPCWPAHPGVVEELAGLWRSWTRTMIADETAKNSGDTSLTAWHDRWLWPALRRLKAGHYRTTNCRDHHQVERITAAPTNRQHVPADPSKLE